MNLIRTSLLSAVAVSVKMASMLAVNKILAIYVGPSGYAFVGQFQNVLTASIALGGAGFSTGVTKYTAEFSGQPEKQHGVWSVAAIVSVVGSCLIALAIAVFRRHLASGLLNDAEHADVFLWMAVALPLLVFNTLLLAILNGKKAVLDFVLANIANSVAALGIVALGVWMAGLKGALVALVVSQSIATLFVFWVCVRKEWFRLSYFRKRFEKGMLKLLSHYSLMALATSLLGPLSQLMARNHIMNFSGDSIAGQWEAINRISGIYLMLITTPLSVYYLPRLSEIKDRSQLIKEILNGYKLLVPIAILGALSIYVIRDHLIRLLFTPDFEGMRNLFMWQMIGDVFRVSAWLLSFYLLSKTMTKEFLFAEVVFSLSFVFLVWWTIRYVGSAGATFAYAINNMAYLLVLVLIVRKSFTR